MPRWRLWGATINNQHYEDDFIVWMSSSGDHGIAAVADGVTASIGGPASFTAVNGLIYMCRSILHEPVEVDRVEKCAVLLGKLFEDEPDRDTLASIAAAKAAYYEECCRDNTPCTKPLTLQLLEDGFKPPRSEAAERKKRIVLERNTMPATTLLAMIVKGEHVGVIMAGDGTLFGLGKTSTESWVVWGALPRFAQETRMASYYEYGRGLVGEPLTMVLKVQPRRLLVLATDGIDPGVLYEVSLEAAKNLVENPSSLGNPAAWILSRVRDKVGGFDDDATLVVAFREE